MLTQSRRITLLLSFKTLLETCLESFIQQCPWSFSRMSWPMLHTSLSFPSRVWTVPIQLLSCLVAMFLVPSVPLFSHSSLVLAVLVLSTHQPSPPAVSLTPLAKRAIFQPSLALLVLEPLHMSTNSARCVQETGSRVR